MDIADIEKLKDHLNRQYAGIFDDEIIQLHITEYVDTSNADIFASYLVRQGCKGKKLLDVGAGYGSIVLAARRQGIEACGVELEEFEVEFARNRLKKEMPNEKPKTVYLQGNALSLPFEPESFDVVTIMNVMEHVPDYKKLLNEAIRVLRPGGMLYAVCPNYAAFRREAHYLVPWLPLLPRNMALLYLKLLRRNPGFFQSCIFYCTNWGVLRYLSSLPLVIKNQDLEKIEDLSLVNSPEIRSKLLLIKRMKLLWLVKWGLKISFYNPFKHSINLYAIKKQDEK